MEQKRSWWQRLLCRLGWHVWRPGEHYGDWVCCYCSRAVWSDEYLAWGVGGSSEGSGSGSCGESDGGADA